MFTFKFVSTGLGSVAYNIARYAAGLELTRANVMVGYETRYAIYVHEDMNANHPTGQAKYLEEPARRMVGEITEEVRTLVALGMTMSGAMERAGQKLQRRSMDLVPVDTGLLKSTAFTRVE